MYLSNGIIQKKISKIWPGPFRRVSSMMSSPTTSRDGCIGRTTIPVFLRTVILQFRSGEGPLGPQDCGPGAVRTRGRSGVRPKNVTLRNGPRPKRRIFRKKSERGGGRRVAGTVAPGRKGRAGRRRPDRRTTVRGPEHRHQAVSGIASGHLSPNGISRVVDPSPRARICALTRACVWLRNSSCIGARAKGLYSSCRLSLHTEVLQWVVQIFPTNLETQWIPSSWVSWRLPPVPG